MSSTRMMKTPADLVVGVHDRQYFPLTTEEVEKKFATEVTENTECREKWVI